MSDEERQEMEYRAERDARWAPTVTDLIPPLIPQTIRDGPRNVRETVNDRNGILTETQNQYLWLQITEYLLLPNIRQKQVVSAEMGSFCRNKDYLQNNLDSAMNNYPFFHNTPP